MAPAFDLPDGILILAQGWGIWQVCKIHGVSIAFLCNEAIVPRAAEVMVRNHPGREIEAVKVAHKLRTMGWKKAKVEQAS